MDFSEMIFRASGSMIDIRQSWILYIIVKLIYELLNVLTLGYIGRRAVDLAQKNKYEEELERMRREFEQEIKKINEQKRQLIKEGVEDITTKITERVLRILDRTEANLLARIEFIKKEYAADFMDKQTLHIGVLYNTVRGELVKATSEELSGEIERIKQQKFRTSKRELLWSGIASMGVIGGLLQGCGMLFDGVEVLVDRFGTDIRDIQSTASSSEVPVNRIKTSMRAIEGAASSSQEVVEPGRNIMIQQIEGSLKLTGAGNTKGMGCARM